MISPINAFKKALFYVSGLCSQRTLNEPGAVIKRLSIETREALKNLKSSDINGDERLDNLKNYIGSEEYYQNKEFEKDKLEFDKKILKDK